MIHIRAAHRNDLPAITRIYAHAVCTGTASFELVAPDEREMRRRFDTLAERDFPYLVADEDGVVVGYAYSGPYRLRPAYRFTTENSIYLSPECRGRGVGAKLLEALICSATQRGFRQMIAVIGDSGNAASIALHRRAGFADVGVFRSVGRKHGRWLDTVLMQRALGDGAEAPAPFEPIDRI